MKMTLAEIETEIRSRQDELALALRRVEALAFVVAQFNFQADGHAVRPGEIDYALRYFEQLVPHLNDALKGVLGASGLSARAGAVFCHKRAKFKLDKPAPNDESVAEIGDLLVVITLHGSDGTRRSAQLIQFKHGNAAITVSDAETPQFTLYNKWPEFSWNRPSAMGHGPRHVSYGGPQDCAKYGLIYAPDFPLLPYLWLPLTMAAQVSQLGGRRTALSVEIARHAAGDTGRRFDPALLNGDWDQVVRELLKSTKGKVARVATQNATAVPIQQGFLAGSIGNVDFSSMGVDGDDNPPDYMEDGDGGISIVHLAIRDGQG